MAQKAKNKTTVKRILWPYEMNEDHKSELGYLGQLDLRADGSYVLTVDRGAQEARADKLIARLTSDGVFGPTKAKTEPRQQPIPDRLAAAIEAARQMVEEAMTDADVFLGDASVRSMKVLFQLQDRYGHGMNALVAEHGFLGDELWNFYQGECFRDEDGDPIGELYRLLDTQEIAELAPKYIGA